jgi:sigma-B regulation protein RsbU (phosphoserine phosphatase)
MARLVSDLRYVSHLKKEMTEILITINELLLERSRRGMFVTLQYIILDNETGQLSIANGGHLPPLWIHRSDFSSDWVACAPGIPLGILPDAIFNKNTIQLQPGDYIVLFTDGVIEAKNKRGVMFSRERLAKLVARKWESPDALVIAIIDEVLKFSSGNSQHDDITVLALKWNE